MLRKRNPPSAANAATAMTAAEENGTERKNRRSIRGWLARFSHTRNAARDTAATTKAPTIRGDDHPRSGASMMPKVSDDKSVITSTCPGTSTLLATGALDSGMYRRARTTAVSPTGMLIQKIDRHPTEDTSAPPTTGPRAMDTPTTAAQTPMAWARSRGMVKVLVMIDMATGLSIDPPTAWTMRKTMSSVRSGATLHRSEPAAKVTSPMTKVRRRPNRSAVDPDSMSRLASTRV